jgi:hypothetical protein
MANFHYDPDVVGRLLDELDAVLYRISKQAPTVSIDPDTGRARHNDSQKAEVSRDLLRAQDLARAIQSELAMTYWRFKGYDDPREGVQHEQAG